MSTRYRVTGSENEALLIYDDEGERMARYFWAPENGGYVREVSDMRPGRLGAQVCERLARDGRALSWSPRRPGGHPAAPLSELIEREFRRREFRREE